MKRHAVMVTWEVLKKDLGLENIYLVQVTDYGLKIHMYGGDEEYVEGAFNLPVETRWTGSPTNHFVKENMIKYCEEF